MTEKQKAFLLGIYRAHYPVLSASEAGNPEIWPIVEEKKYCETYWGIGGTHLKLTEAGYREIGITPP